MSYHDLGAAFDPFATLQQVSTAVQQASDMANKTAQAAQQVQNIFAPPAPAAAPTAPTSASAFKGIRLPIGRQAVFGPAVLGPRGAAGPAMMTPAVVPVAPLSLPPPPPPDDKDDGKKSNTAMYVALGLAAVAAVLLLKKKQG